MTPITEPTLNRLQWRIATASLFNEMLECNEQMWIFKQPLNALYDTMREVAARAIELDDPKLHVLMLRLGLYSVSDPTHPDFNLEETTRLIEHYSNHTR